MRKKSVKTTLKLVWSAPEIKFISDEEGEKLKELIREITQHAREVKRKRQMEEEDLLPFV